MYGQRWMAPMEQRVYMVLVAVVAVLDRVQKYSIFVVVTIKLVAEAAVVALVDVVVMVVWEAQEEDLLMGLYTHAQQRVHHFLF